MTTKSKFKLAIIISIIIFPPIFYFQKDNLQKFFQESTPPEISITNLPQIQELPIINSQESSPEQVFPAELNLKMPFISQAPHANWDLPWQEACEEASMLLIYNVYKDKNFTKDQFNQEILKLVDWQTKKFGDYKHTDISQIQITLKEYFNLNSEIIENPTFKDFQISLNKGHFLILPLAGKRLNNPNFTNGGPNYHVVPVRGYKTNPEKLITNDVGTRKGENYIYSFSTIQNALHDYAVPIESGVPKALVVYPN